MRTFFVQYRQRLQHQHGWEIELDCPVCGNHGLPKYSGWIPDSTIHFGAQPTIFANISCPRCGQDLKQQAGEKLIELFSHVPTPARNRRLIALFIGLLVGLSLLLGALIWAGVQLGWWGHMVYRRPQISGQVFVDLNADGARDAAGGEEGTLAGIKVYQDMDGDGEFDLYEPHAVTDAHGDYSFLASPAPQGTRILVEPKPQHIYVAQTTPTPTFIPRSGEDVVQDIGVVYQVGAMGTVFRDLDGDGRQGAGEPGLPGVVVFWDRSKDGYLQVLQADGTVQTLKSSSSSSFEGLCELAGEPCAVSAADGSFFVEGYVDEQGSIRVNQGGWAGDTLGALPPTFGLLGETITQHELYVAPTVPSMSHYSTILNVEIGVFENAFLEGRVTWDQKGAGQPGHAPIKNVKVYLDLGADGTLDEEATTDENGKYKFWFVGPGPHSVHLGVKSEQMVTYPNQFGHHVARFHLVRPKC